MVAAPLLVILGIGGHNPQDMVFGRILGPLPVRQMGVDGAPQLPADVDDVQLVTPYDGHHQPMEVVLLGVGAIVVRECRNDNCGEGEHAGRGERQCGGIVGADKDEWERWDHRCQRTA